MRYKVKDMTVGYSHGLVMDVYANWRGKVFGGGYDGWESRSNLPRRVARKLGQEGLNMVSFSRD
jgi:hypothetical protein